jgi:hypothetical protein
MKSRSIGGVTADAAVVAAVAVEVDADVAVAGAVEGESEDGGVAMCTAGAAVAFDVLAEMLVEPVYVLGGAAANGSTYVLLAEAAVVMAGPAGGSSDRSWSESAGSTVSFARSVAKESS